MGKRERTRKRETKRKKLRKERGERKGRAFRDGQREDRRAYQSVRSPTSTAEFDRQNGRQKIYVRLQASVGKKSSISFQNPRENEFLERSNKTDALVKIS